MRRLSVAVVGVDHPNKRGPSRRFEISMCSPGETVKLQLEPRNPVDPNAVAVFSARGIQIGYVNAERASWIAGMMRQGRVITAMYQGDAPFGAWARIAFDGEQPTLPPVSQSPALASRIESVDGDPGFFPDPIHDD